MLQRSNFQGSMHTVDAIELRGYFAQLFRVHDLKEFVPLAPQSSFFRTVGGGHRLGYRLQTRILAGPCFHFSGENNCRRRSTPNHGSESSFESRHLESLIQHPGEHDISAAVVAGDHTENHRALEIHDRSPNFRAVFQLQLAHRFRGAIETR